jgi:hypothetical protein
MNNRGKTNLGDKIIMEWISRKWQMNIMKILMNKWLYKGERIVHNSFNTQKWLK